MQPGKRMTKVLAGFVGNIVEWYDFAVYGYMAGILSTLFFPSDDTATALISTYGVFAAGFVMRPIGSGVFGWLGDAIGRSRTMLISVTLMVLPTFLLGCLPTYQQVGVLAPILLVLIRLVQGFSAGGEFSSSVTYLVESAEPGRWGIAGSWANTGSMFGTMLGAGIAALVVSVMPKDSVNAWGWRLPFLFGGTIGVISILMRRHLPESEHFQRHHAERAETSPLLEAFTTNRREMILAIVFASAYGVLFYLPIVYLPEWLHSEVGMPRKQALQINTAATVLLLFLIPLSGWIGDRLVRRTHFIAAAMLLLALTGWPLYHWLTGGSWDAAVMVQVLLIVFIAVPLGSAPAMFAELFPARDRLSGYSVAYNLGLGVVGGTTPMLSTWLIETSGYSAAPAVYLVLMAGVAFVTLMLMKDRSREALR